MTQNLKFKYASSINSCRPGESELQQGEEVVLELKDKNPLWPASVIATVALVTSLHAPAREYTLDYDDDDLNGGPILESCDISEIRCYSCCDSINERLNSLISVLPVTENADGSFTYNG